MEHIQIKLTKFGQQISSLSWPMSGRQTRRLAGWDSHDTERPFLVKFTRWVGKGMISAGEGMRHSNALLSGSDQFWLGLFGCAPQLNNGTECYIFKMGLSICKQLETPFSSFTTITKAETKQMQKGYKQAYCIPWWSS